MPDEVREDPVRI